ncbi:hypothetical protein GOV10_04635 [Candidatus Woesearchaeota archaeon]|nr:hypothetical protein [Candidatus Woesearchaeota archaeon]
MVQDSDESFLDYILRETDNPAQADKWPANKLFPELNDSEDNIKRRCGENLVLDPLTVSPKFYLPGSLLEMQKKGIKIRPLVEQSIAELQHCNNVKRYIDKKAPHFEMDAYTLEGLEERYTQLLVQDVELNVKFRKEASENLLLQTKENNYLIEDFETEKDYFDVATVEGEELEEILKDERVPIIKLSNVSKYLDVEEVLELGTNSYKDMRNLREQGIISPDSE